MTKQMQRIMRQNNEELYGKFEGIKNQLNRDVGGPNVDRRWQARKGIRYEEGGLRKNRVEGVKLIVSPFKHED